MWMIVGVSMGPMTAISHGMDNGFAKWGRCPNMVFAFARCGAGGSSCSFHPRLNSSASGAWCRSCSYTIVFVNSKANYYYYFFLVRLNLRSFLVLIDLRFFSFFRAWLTWARSIHNQVTISIPTSGSMQVRSRVRTNLSFCNHKAPAHSRSGRIIVTESVKSGLMAGVPSASMNPAGLEPAIPGSVGRCLIHWATGPYLKSQMLNTILIAWLRMKNLSTWHPCHWLRYWAQRCDVHASQNQYYCGNHNSRISSYPIVVWSVRVMHVCV